MKHASFFGIDLTSTDAKPSACLGLDNASRLVYLGFLTSDTDIIALLNFYSPRVVAINAPLSLPLGLCCLEETCPCEPRFPWKNRRCDQELRRQGISCYPTSKKTFVKDLIYRGIELKTRIGREVKRGGQVIEVYPFASKIRLFGKTIPRKTTKQGMRFMSEKLWEVLPGLKPYLDVFGNDLYDAAVAAYTAFLHYQNRVDALRSSEEGLIYIPIKR